MALDLKEKCKETGRSLQWMLTVLVEEEIITRVLESPFTDKVALGGSYVIQSLGSIKTDLLPKLEITLDPEDKDGVIEEIGKERDPLVKISDMAEIADAGSESLSVMLVKAVAYGVPITLYMDIISEVNEMKGSFGKELPKLSGEGEAFTLKHTFPEEIFSKRLQEVILKRETLDSMTTWYDMFYISAAMSLDGHKLGEFMGNKISREDMARFEDLNKTKDLCTRWRAFARENRVPLWDLKDLTEHLSSVTSPISHAISSGEEFFGTWMPELCRYID